jgi:DNA polymerase-3 subunit epsilon
VIDVAVFRFKGGEIMGKFQSLINPGRPIPQWITAFTGIDDDMVKNAPSFSEIAEPLYEFLSNGIFTAHNAGFDYGFLQSEFIRAGRPLVRPQCCTLRLARRLMPELPSRSLGNLCESLLIDIWDRHRAHGDAEATVYVLKEFLRQLESHHGITTWPDLQAFLDFGALVLPRGIDYKTVFSLPGKPGVYIFKDQEGNVVCQGKVSNVQRRVQSYFKQTNTSEKSKKLREIVRTIQVLPM